MQRRTIIAGILTASTGAVAGCLDDFLDELTSHEATPATVVDSALTDTGYSHGESTTQTEQEEFGGETVEVTNHLNQYHRSVTLQDEQDVEGAIFAVISSPRVSIGGQEFNPLGELDDRQLVDLVQDQYTDLTIDSSVGNRSIPTLGTTAELTTFEGEATVTDGLAIPVRIGVSQFDHADDHLVTVGIYPAQFPDESDRVDILIEGLEHDS